MTYTTSDAGSRAHRDRQPPRFYLGQSVRVGDLVCVVLQVGHLVGQVRVRAAGGKVFDVAINEVRT